MIALPSRTAGAALALAACAFVSTPAFAALAQAPAEEAAKESTAPDKAKRGRYLLRLATGQVVRGVARETESSWQVQRGRDWQTLPEGSVVSARAEKEVLAEARRMRRSTEREDAAQRAALATWMTEQGLLAEAATELDQILTLEPDQPQALKLIETSDFPANLPQRGDTDEAAWRKELITFGAKATPLGRELVTSELAELDDLDTLGATLREELEAGSDRRRAFAALAMRRLFPGRQIKPLITRAVLDSSEDVRREAAVALRGANDAGVIVPIVKALESPTPAVRTNAAQALGHVGHPAAVEPLMLSLLSMAQGSGTRRVPHSHIYVGRQLAYIQDFKVEVAQRQAVADPQINVLTTGGVLDAGVHSVREYVTTHEKRVTRAALRRLTGQNPGDRIADWRRWWEENKDEWRSSDLSKPPVTGADTREARGPAVPPEPPKVREEQEGIRTASHAQTLGSLLETPSDLDNLVWQLERNVGPQGHQGATAPCMPSPWIRPRPVTRFTTSSFERFL